jgi:uncharacterized membrane protein (UPF0127 family)
MQHLAHRAAGTGFILSILSAGQALPGCTPPARTAAVQAPGKMAELGPTVTVHAPGAPVHLEVELARSAAEQDRGLMFRRHLPNNYGMLFVFPAAAPRYFWMHNTYVALDMIFIDAAQTVVEVVHRAEPLSRTSRGTSIPCQYVLEVAAGFAARHRVAPGTKISVQGLTL